MVRSAAGRQGMSPSPLASPPPALELRLYLHLTGGLGPSPHVLSPAWRTPAMPVCPVWAEERSSDLRCANAGEDDGGGAAHCAEEGCVDGAESSRVGHCALFFVSKCMGEKGYRIRRKCIQCRETGHRAQTSRLLIPVTFTPILPA